LLGSGPERSKGCGKSAPRFWRQGRHGKPHRVQDRIGAPHELVPARRPGWLLEPRREPGPRGMAAHPPTRKATAEDRTRLTGPLAFIYAQARRRKSRGRRIRTVTARLSSPSRLRVETIFSLPATVG